MDQINIPSKGNLDRIVIIGAGFAGLRLARKLKRAGKYQVLLLDKNNFHQFQPLFYQVAMSGLEPSSISFPIRKLFRQNKDIYFRVGDLQRVDPDQKKIYTDIGVVDYDKLVIAIGARSNYYGNEELQNQTYPLKSVSDAIFVRNSLLEDFEKALESTDYEKRQGLIDIVIVGGGPTGVELAGALAEMKKYIIPKDYQELNNKEVDIYLIQGEEVLLNGMSSNASKKALEFLNRLGVHVKLNTLVTGFDGTYIHMNNGEKIKSNKVLWAAGITGIKIQGLPKESYVKGNRLLTDSFHKVNGVDDIYAIGDIALLKGDKKNPDGHPQVAQVAIQMATSLAKNLSREPRKSKPFQYKDKGSMATIGRNKAVVDLPGKISFSGFFAWIIWLFVHLFALIGTKNKIFVMINWIWNYITYDQSLRLIIKPKTSRGEGLD